MLRVSTTIVVSSLLFCLILAGQSISATDLYPACGDVKVFMTTRPNHTITLYTFPRASQSFSLDCFASEVFNANDGQKLAHNDQDIDHCHVEGQSEYRYNLAVRATYTDDKGVTQTRNFSIRDLYAGSLTKPVFQMPVRSIFSIVFTNLAQSDECRLGILATFNFFQSDLSEKDNNLTLTPALVGIRPPTVYPRSNSETFLVLQYPPSVREEEILNSVVKLVDLEKSCEEPGFANYTNPTKKLPDEFFPTDALSRYYSRVYDSHTPGIYRVCYILNQASTVHQLGIVTTFKGNPSFYDIINLEDRDVIPAHTPLYIRFHGYMLDTREKGDIAKLVYDDQSCVDGLPARGVSANTRLLPKGNYGHNSTHAIWRVVVRKPGTYKVCYKPGSSEWVEVLSKNVVWPNVDAVPNSSHGTFPIPIDPVTKKACPTAPTDRFAWTDYTSLRFTMKKSKQLTAFSSMVVSLFCVPRSAFAVLRMTHDKTGKQIVYIAFECTGVTLKDGQAACDSMERSNYAVTLSQFNSILLSENDIDQIVGSTSMAISSDDPEIFSQTRSVLVTLTICVTLLACTAVLVGGFLKYHQRRQYFVQFGMEDDEVDDMYGRGMMPAGMDKDNATNVSP